MSTSLRRNRESYLFRNNRNILLQKMFQIFPLIVLFAVSSIEIKVTSPFGSYQLTISYLNAALDMITKVKLNTPIREKERINDCDGARAVDCADIFHMGFKESGVYKVRPMNKCIDVYCDMETDGGGWTVIQRRGDFQSPKDYFFKDWKNYKEGFGDLEKDFWLGNDNIFALTNQKLYSARFDLKDVDQQKRYALYEEFWIDDEDHKYTLHISGYSGDAGDSISAFDNIKFSTKDQDNDGRSFTNCADLYKGGWWYGPGHSSLNGLYHKGEHDESYADGVNWKTWKGNFESLEWTEIKIRPKNCRRSP